MSNDNPIKSFSLLVVDDEVLTRNYLASVIPDLAPVWQVDGIACDGVEALACLRQHSFDLVITDVAMPEMNGLDLARAIQQSYPQTVVVILSGFDEFDFAQKAVRFGVFDYLLKPLDDDDLKEVLERAANHISKVKAADASRVLKLPAFHDEMSIPHGKLVDRAIDYICNHYREPISLSDVARYLQLSDSYLSDIFHKTTGEPYSKFITRIRMEKAAELLLQYNQIKIYQVSERVGFLSTKHFMTVFKKTFGVTPSEYQASAGQITPEAKPD